jgi:hypothetical protein
MPQCILRLDVHHSASTANAMAVAGREAWRFVGTVAAGRFTQLSKALGKLGEPSSLFVVYEAGPCGYGLVRELRARATAARSWCPTRLRANLVNGSRPTCGQLPSWLRAG